MSNQNAADDVVNRSGGGIVFGGGTRSRSGDIGDLSELARGFRRRWASGIAVVTATESDGSLRGITATSLMVVSQEPPLVAVALSAEGSFVDLAGVGESLGVSVLEAVHEFPAERFSGRAPLPDARLTGIAHRLEYGVPILQGSLAWCAGEVTQVIPAGDHWLVLMQIQAGALGEDTDDPLLSYEGRYRRLEAG